MTDALPRLLKVEGVSAALIGVSIFFFFACPIFVAARVIIRLRKRCFGVDDYFMCAAVVSALSIYCGPDEF
jgi:hypothetical protein